MAKIGTYQVSPAAGSTGVYLMSEQFGLTATGISGATTTPAEVQVHKIAWGKTGEFYWASEDTSGAGTAGAGAGPIPIQLRDASGNAISSSAIASSSNKMLDVNIRNQGGSAAQLDISNIGAGSYATAGKYIAVAGTTNGGYVPIAGSTAGGAIPHIGASSDGYLTSPTGGTQGWEGTISEKLRTMTSALHLLKHGGTGNDGAYAIHGLSMDLRSAVGGVTVASFDTQLAGFTYTNSIQAIKGGVTIGIGSVSIDNPVVIGSRTAGTAFERVNGTSTTLQSGVRVKNVAGSGTIHVGYDSAAGSTTGMTQGFQLDDAEEMFVEVDNLNKVYVKASSAGLTFSYYAT